MKICCVQFGHVSTDADLARVDGMLGAVVKGNVDLMVFPEACFSPYLFESPQDALKRGAEEKAMKFLKTKAIEKKCGVVAGLVVKYGVREADNVFVVIDPNGNELVRRSKVFPYPPSDALWQRRQHDSDVKFEIVELPWLNNLRVMFAICNDINCQEYEVDFWDYPLATAALTQHAQVVVLLAAWCSQHPTATAAQHDKPVMPSEQLTYWKDRLKPLLGTKTHFVCADRIGRERIPSHAQNALLRYCGTSCVMDLYREKVLAVLGTEEENVLMVEFEPYE